MEYLCSSKKKYMDYRVAIPESWKRICKFGQDKQVAIEDH
jgi:hypothetical protein